MKKKKKWEKPRIEEVVQESKIFARVCLKSNPESWGCWFSTNEWARYGGHS